MVSETETYKHVVVLAASAIGKRIVSQLDLTQIRDLSDRPNE
jgi:hypothetical protein